jgi:hypothetical protein
MRGSVEVKGRRIRIRRRGEEMSVACVKLQVSFGCG